MMDPKVKEDWLEALRSGEYEQCQEFLEEDGANCCLGVLADISDGVTAHGGYFYFEMDGWSDCLNISPGFRERVGLSPIELHTLVDLNDNKLATFLEIADYIEVTL